MARAIHYIYGTAALACCLGVTGAAPAASLRPFREVPGGVVHLSDLFDRLEATPDRDLGPAPAPGARIVVEAPQLAAIARDFGVAWRPRSGAERAVLERSGVVLAEEVVRARLRAALIRAGAPDDADIDLGGFVPPMLPRGTVAQADIAQVTYDTATCRFRAVLSVSAADMAPVHLELAGSVIAVAQAAVLTRRVHPGVVLAGDDVRIARVHTALLRGNAPVAEAAVIGMALRRDVPVGQPLTVADVVRPVLVARNGAVRMNLNAAGISLSAQGVALEDGALGDRVRVQNPSSRATVLAEVTGDAEVRVIPAP